MPLCHRPDGPLSALLVAILVLGLPSWAATPAFGQGEAAESAGPVFDISEFVVEYADDATEQDGLPALEGLVPVEVSLVRRGDAWAAPQPGEAAEVVHVGTARDAVPGAPRRFHASAVAAVARALLQRVQDQRLLGARVAPHPDDIDLRSERDLRPAERTALRLQIGLGRVKELRSIAVGDRISEDWIVNNPLHRQIRRRSPIQPSGGLTDGSTDLLRRDELEDYLFRLNRHSGRRVDAALAASEDGSGIALDLRVHESKPWFAYFQSSDTGTERTDEWQHRFGYVHRQVTDRDDVLNLQYTNAGGNDLHALYASYEAPWFSGERADWWKTQPDEDTWQRWMNRDRWPWFGLDGLRWRVVGSWNRFEARSSAPVEKVRGQQWNVDGRLIYQAFQYRNFFVDLFAGTRALNVEVRNDNFPTNSSPNEFFLLPQVGIQTERIAETSTLRGTLEFETNITSTNDDDLLLLGRRDPEPQWRLLHYDVGITQFLEPLLFGDSWKNPSTPLTSTLAHEVAFGIRGQYAFGDRLIPQATQVVGGLFSVRGYEQSAASGDSAFVTSFEYRFHLPHALPIQREPLEVPLLGRFRAAPQQVWGRPDWDLALKGFIDYGRTLRYGNLATETNDELLGVGAGIEFRYKHHLTLRTEWGRALSSTPSTPSGNDEFHFLISILY